MMTFNMSTQMLNKKPLRILGIDPGYGRLGVSIIEKNNSKDILVFSTCITTKKELGISERIFVIAKEIESLIIEHKPTEMAIETLFFNTNQKTAFMVAETRGALLLTAIRGGLTTFEYTPAQIKNATTGYGKSDKKAIILMIPKLITLTKKIDLDDEYDAIAIALTHSACRKINLS